MSERLCDRTGKTEKRVVLFFMITCERVFVVLVRGRDRAGPAAAGESTELHELA